MQHECDTNSYLDLLVKDKALTIHERNIQSLAIELFKVTQNLSNVIISNIFKKRTLTYNLRSQTDFVRDSVNTQRYGLNSRLFRSKGLGYDSFRNKEHKFSSKI